MGNPTLGLAYHLECTELLSFLAMLQRSNTFVIGNINYMYLTSLGTERPLSFVPYVGVESPAAVMCLFDNKEMPKAIYYRRKDVPIRTLTMDGNLYKEYRNLVYPAGSKMHYLCTWAGLVEVSGLLGNKEVRPHGHCSNMTVPST